MNGIYNELGKRLLYFDGGMGTLLQDMGLSGGERPETWNLIYPDRIAQVHRRYLEAGCDIVTTNTFGATSAHLGEAAQSCMRAGVRIAREAVSRFMRGYVAADMGPSAACWPRTETFPSRLRCACSRMPLPPPSMRARTFC